MDPSGLFLPGSIVQLLYHFLGRALHLRLLLGLGLLLRVISVHGLLLKHSYQNRLKDITERKKLKSIQKGFRTSNIQLMSWGKKYASLQDHKQ
jgi:hypothetical protein